MSVLLLRLSGPMQSWGSRSRFTERDTEREPTKSGVIGLLCAALGKPRMEEPEDGFPALSDLAALKMGVRVDREGDVRRDYQTAGGGSWPGVKSYGVATADGKSRKPEVSNRYYLADAVFLVGLEGSFELLSRLHRALGEPVWPLYLGRKSYVPGEPVRLADGLLETALLTDALAKWPSLVADRSRGRRTPDRKARFVVECAPGDDGDPRQDVPICFRHEAREHGVRRVSQFFAPLPKDEKEAAQCT